MTDEMFRIYGRSLMLEALAKEVKASKLKGEELKQMKKRIETNINNGTFDHEYRTNESLEGKFECVKPNV